MKLLIVALLLAQSSKDRVLTQWELASRAWKCGQMSALIGQSKQQHIPAEAAEQVFKLASCEAIKKQIDLSDKSERP